MALRSTAHLLRLTVRTLVVLTVVGLVLFFGLTRTQSGRDALRDQIERAFDARFRGSLEIERLEGTLLDDLYASDVRLYDPDGRLVARVDSVALRPSWRRFLGRQAAFRKATIIRPQVTAVYDDSAGWNLARALDRVAPGSSERPWDVTVPRVEIHGGHVTTRRTGDPPPLVQRGTLFDYARADVRDVQARLAVDWRDGGTVDVDHLAAHLVAPDTFRIDSLSGQLVIDGPQRALNQVRLRTGTSRLTGAAAWTPAGDGAPAEASLTLDGPRIDFDEWRTLFPALPLRDAAAVALRLHGPTDDLVLEELALARGRTRLDGAATVSGLPERAEVDLAFHDNTVDARDLEVLWPDGPFDVARHLGTLRFDLTGDGTVRLDAPIATAPLTVQGRLDAVGRSGRIDASFQLAGTARDPAFHAVADAERLDLGHLLRRPDLASAIDGRFRFQAADDRSATRLTLALADARLAGVPLTGLEADVTFDADRVGAEASLPQASGGWRAEGRYLRNAREVDLRVRTDGGDLGPLLGVDSLTTRLDGWMTARAVLPPEGAPSGTLTLRLDSSHVKHGAVDQTLRPASLTASLTAPAPGSARLDVSGDLLEATVEVDDELEHAGALAALWTRAAARFAWEAWDKPYRADTSAAPMSQPAVASLPQPAPTALPDRLVRAEATVAVARTAWLRALWPGLPPFSLPLRARAELWAGPDTLAASGTVASDSLVLRTLRVQAAEGTFSLHAGPPDRLSETLAARAALRGERLTIGEQVLAEPRLRTVYDGRAADIELTTGRAERPGPARLAATLELLPDRNRLTFRRLELAVQGTHWSQDEPQHVDLYRGAAVVPHLTLRGEGETGRTQRLTARGVVSAAPADTLVVAASDLALHEVSALGRLPRRVGGFADGRLAYTGGLERPEVTGTVRVDRLAFDDRLLGTLSLSARYLAGTPDVALQGHLVPPAMDADRRLPGTDRRGRIEPNRLAVDGTIRFPELRERRLSDPGRLDLAVRADHVDAFFFDYIFRNLLEDTRGTITGRVNVGGSFAKPLFDARLELADGRFRVPRYDLRFDAAGHFSADAEGIHILGAELIDPTGGTAHFTGSLLFNDYRFFSLDLHGVLDEVQVMNVESARELPFYGHIWASGDLYLQGPLDAAELRAPNARTTPESEVYIPIAESAAATDTGFILFADSTGRLPDVEQLTRRRSVLQRPEGERRFAEGLDMRLNIQAPSGSTVHLVIDPLVGETIDAVGNGRVQLLRTGDDFSTYGELTVEGGDYLFSAGELLFRRFELDPGGTITWDGDPIDPRLDLTAFYRTRASSAGLPDNLAAAMPGLIPVVVRLHVTDRITAPEVGLELVVDRSDRDRLGTYEGLEAYLNQSDRAPELATSVLLTNSFLLTTALAETSGGQALTDTRNQLAFNSLSQLVASQLNRYLSQAIPNFDVTLGLQGQSAQDLGVTYGVALRLLDERLIIRGQGVYQNQTEQTARQAQGLEGEFVVEVRLNPSVSVEVFYRREGDVLESELTNTTGAGLSYETRFTTWPALFRRFLSWLAPRDETDDPPPEEVAASEG